MTVYLPVGENNRALPPGSRPAGPIDPAEIASLTVRVRSVGNPEDLARKAYELADTPLSKRNYLTHQELEQSHGARADDLNKVEHFAHENDLTVVHRSAAGRTVVLKGTLGNLLAAFPADVQMYHHVMGTYRGRLGEISAPKELAPLITEIFGLDTRPKHRPYPRHPNMKGLSGPAGQSINFSTSDCTANQEGIPCGGAGQTIALVELGRGPPNCKMPEWLSKLGCVVPKLSVISADHAGTTSPTQCSGDYEAMLNVLVIGALAPKANVAVYLGSNNGDQGFIDALSSAIHDRERKPGILAINWGSPEVATELQGINACHELFAAAGALGITVCAASGDHDSNDIDWIQGDRRFDVSHPACDDLVLACGATPIGPLSAEALWKGAKSFNVNVNSGLSRLSSADGLRSTGTLEHLRARCDEIADSLGTHCAQHRLDGAIGTTRNLSPGVLDPHKVQSSPSAGYPMTQHRRRHVVRPRPIGNGVRGWVLSFSGARGVYMVLCGGTTNGSVMTTTLSGSIGVEITFHETGHRLLKPKKELAAPLLKQWNAAIASVVSQTRRDADISQQALADMMGWHRSKVVKIEAGKISLRAAELILVVAELKIDPQQLLTRVLRWNTRG